MHTALKILTVVLLAGAALWALYPASSRAAAPPEVSVPTGDPGWRLDPLWDDGLAEFCAYEVTWARYGHHFPGRALLILVKEPWQPELDVKADDPGPESFEVLKLNHIRDVPTGIYTYHQMASVFLRRDDGSLRKIAATSSEACGVSTARMTRGRLATHSYFDGQADRARDYPDGTVPEDGLPAMLRGFVAGGADLPDELAVFPSLLAGRYADLSPVAYRVDRQAVSAEDAGGEPVEAVELRLENRRGWLSYTFAAAPPHRLLAHQRSDGTEYRVAKCARLPYWTMHDPGGEEWLPDAVR